jgi:hypothetical protein
MFIENKQRSLTPKNKWIKITCRHCGLVFYAVPCIARYAVSCSLSCRMKSQKNHWYPPKINLGKQTDYKRICVDGKIVREHRYLMEKQLCRKLKTTEHVHHKDGNKFNNAIENLEILNKSEHHKLESNKFMQIIGHSRMLQEAI